MNSRERSVANPRAPDGFDLSRNKSLRTLETTSWSIEASHRVGSNFLRAVLSSITSPAPIDFVLIYQNGDFDVKRPCRLCTTQPAPIPYCYYSPWGGLDTEVDHFYLNSNSQFTVIQEMHSVRRFRLGFCLDVSDCVIGYALETLQRILRTEELRGGFDYLLDGSFVTCERRVLRVGHTPVVRSMAKMPPTSAL